MNSKPTPGTWEAVPDPHNASNPYWHAVDIHAGPLLVARVQCTNAQRQGPANAAILAAAQDLKAHLEDALSYVDYVANNGNACAHELAANIRTLLRKLGDTSC